MYAELFNENENKNDLIKQFKKIKLFGCFYCYYFSVHVTISQTLSATTLKSDTFIK